MDFDFSDLVGPFSALAAFVSAAIAYQANRNVAKSDRVRQVREVSLLANKVVAATIHIDDLSNELKMGYQTLFTFAGQGGGSSRLKLYVDEVEKKQTAIGPMQQAAWSVLDNDPQKLSDEQITDRLLEFEGNLAHLDRVREKFHHDLASIESQNQLYRQAVIEEPSKVIGPGTKTTNPQMWVCGFRLNWTNPTIEIPAAR